MKAFLTALILVLAACGGDDETGAQPIGSLGGETGSWQLASGVVDGEPLTLVDTHPVTLELDGVAPGGIAACNHYGVRFSDQLPHAIDRTDMACMPLEAMELESTFLTALAAVTEWRRHGDALVLTGKAIELRFDALEPVEASRLLNRVWALEAVVIDGVTTSPRGERATLELFSDGSFIGSTGCRTVAGSYRIVGAGVVFNDWGAEGECPTELMDQDSLVISVLEGGFRVGFDGDRMTIGGADGESLIYLVDQ